MINIDGSYLEGGGQILRSSLSLSAILDVPFRIVNIRANRSNPGLRPQHLSSITALAEVTNAKIDGAHIGSKELVFEPSLDITQTEFNFDIGTAGSVVLLIQAILPVLLHSKKSFNINVKGGTHVTKSPTYEYFEHAFLYNLRNMGARVESFMINPGFYPIGNGEVNIRVNPSNMKSYNFIGDDSFNPYISAYITTANLPRLINDKEGQFLAKYDIDDIYEDFYPSNPSTGNAISIIAKYKNYAIGVEGLGAKGLPAEKLAKIVYSRILKEIKNPGLDAHMVDQLLMYIALYGGKIQYNAPLSNHSKTNMYVIERFMDGKFEINDNYIYFS